eukprot:scaffold30128_cov59-Phaeocystis_antarctica.AAC.3
MSLTPDDVARMKVPELKAALEERHQDATGRKPVLVERLLEAIADSFVGEGSSASGGKKKAESPAEEPPAKKAKGKTAAKGKAAAKEEAAEPADEAAKKGKGKAAPA